MKIVDEVKESEKDNNLLDSSYSNDSLELENLGSKLGNELINSNTN